MLLTNSPVKYLRSEGVFHSETSPSVETSDGLKQWYFKGDLHRANAPAVETPLGTALYFWRGRLVTRKIACGEIKDTKEIMNIPNIEVRRCAMERAGYLAFENQMEKIDATDDGMYELFKLEIPKDEPLVTLKMRDPSLGSFYFIRVNPKETKCKLAVAHSYGFSSWDDYQADVWK